MDFNSIKQCVQFILWLFGDAYRGYISRNNYNVIHGSR